MCFIQCSKANTGKLGAKFERLSGATLPAMLTQFFITTQPAPFLNGKHVVFGKVVDNESMHTVRKIENVGSGANNRPRMDVRIAGTFFDKI